MANGLLRYCSPCNTWCEYVEDSGYCGITACINRTFTSDHTTANAEIQSGTGRLKEIHSGTGGLTMADLKPCPFCGEKHEVKKPYLNIICQCGAKYYFLGKFWLDRKTGKVVAENGGKL